MLAVAIAFAACDENDDTVEGMLSQAQLDTLPPSAQILQRTYCSQGLKYDSPQDQAEARARGELMLSALLTELERNPEAGIETKQYSSDEQRSVDVTLTLVEHTRIDIKNRLEESTQPDHACIRNLKQRIGAAIQAAEAPEP